MSTNTPVPDQAASGNGRSAEKRFAWNTTKTIAWGFFGVRRRKDHDLESTPISPLHVVIAGFVGVFLLVAGLIVLVNWVVA